MKVERDWEPTKLLFAQESQGEGPPGGLLCNCAGESLGVPSHELSIRMPPQTREARCQTPITITIVLALLCCYYDKNTPTKSLTEERVCCRSRFGAQSIVVRTSRQQDPDTAGHVVSTPVRRVQRMHTTAQLLLSISAVSTHPSQGPVPPAADWFSHPSYHTPDNL